MLQDAGNLLKEVFNSPAKRPPAESFTGRDQIAGFVHADFPRRFSDTFDNWLEQDEAFRQSIEGGKETAVAQAYRTAFDALWQNWLRIVHFFPFILMVCINRLNRATVKEHAADELGKAIYLYEIFYSPPESTDKREADQRLLLSALLALFRKLGRAGVLGPDFFLSPVLGGRSFPEVFPDRFDGEILLLQQIRNRNTHHQLGQRPARYLAGIYDLLAWCFLDIVALLAPVCAEFRLVYVTGISDDPLEDGNYLVSGSSLSGPFDRESVEYLLAPGYRSDSSALLERQLYIVARSKELGAGSGSPLEPGDYLDLTPFLIFESSTSGSAPEGASGQQQDERHLFLLNEYEESKRFVQFLEFAGAFNRTIPRGGGRQKGGSAGQSVDPAERDEAERLLLEIRFFRETVSRLGASVPSGVYASERGLDARFLRKKFWDISKAHLTGVLAVEQFTEDGLFIEESVSAIARTSYVPSLFVAPAESADLDAFFQSGRAGIVLAGQSGAGKSSLMVDAFLRRLEAGDLSMFLTGRLIQESSIADYLKKDCFSRLTERDLKFPDFDAWLRRNNLRMTLFVDAVNEFSQTGGPLALLESLVNFAADSPLKQCRVVLSVRSEVWSQFRERMGDRPLRPDRFHAPSGDAVHMTAFTEDARCRELYGSYQRFFRLEPARYERLKPAVRDLVRQPFMMGLVAETYSNLGRAADQPVRTIPSDLNYFDLFNSLTARKAADSTRLFRASDARAETIAHDVRECLQVFAQLIYLRLTGGAGLPRRIGAGAGAAAPGFADAIPYALAYSYRGLRKFHKPVSRSSSLSVFGIVLQLGLIERTFVPEIDETGQECQGRAFKFFHDQYTQRCLAVVYRTDVLGAASSQDLARPEALKTLIEKIAGLLMRSVDAPVLGGAVDHWYHSNMRRAAGQAPDLLFPLLNGLAEKDAPGVRYYVCSLLSNLILRDIVPPSELCAAVFKHGSRRLRLILADAFNDFWPDLPPKALSSIVDAADKEKDDFVFGRLADIFALHFGDAPGETLTYISEAMMPVSGVLDLTGVVAQGARFEKHLTFTLFFTFTSIRAHSDDPEKLEKIHAFIYENYRLLIESIAGDYGMSPLKNVVRSQVYGRIQDTAKDVWERLGATQNGNNYCFVEHHGLCQRDVIYDFFPYAAAIHNGNFETASIRPGAPLRELAIRMLTFEVTSIVGYKATVVLPLVLRRNWEDAEAFILDVLAVDNPSARFFGILLLVNISYTDPSLSARCLELLLGKILPGMLERRQEAEWAILHSMGIVDNDVEQLWPHGERILRAIFDDLESRGSEEEAAKLGGELLKASFFHDVRLGLNLAGFMLDRGALDDPLWRRAAFKVLAGLAARSPAALHRLVLDRVLPEATLREARGYLGDEILAERDLFMNQVRWNRFFGKIMAENVILRCLTLTCIVAGFAQSNSTLEFAREFRRFLVSAVKAYYGKDGGESRYAHIDVAKALDECENRRQSGGGVVHKSWS